MNREAVDFIVEKVRALGPEDRIAVADEVDRIAWRDRVQVVLDEIAENVRREGPISDAEIDAIVKDVRAEKSLYERYWTRRRQSAPRRVSDTLDPSIVERRPAEA